jgi:hypothetical protein
MVVGILPSRLCGGVRLESCIVVRVATNPKLIFAEKNFSLQCWSHNVKDLLVLAGVDAAFHSECVANPTLGQNWLVVKAWSEISRYQMKSQVEAENLYGAITDNNNGVLPWIRLRW